MSVRELQDYIKRENPTLRAGGIIPQAEGPVWVKGEIELSPSIHLSLCFLTTDAV